MVFVLAVVGCGATGPSATPDATATLTPPPTTVLASTPTLTLTPPATTVLVPTPAQRPTPTPTLIPSPTSTPILGAADAFSILRAAEEKLGAATSFHVTVAQEDSDGAATTAIDILRPDAIRLVTDFSADGGMAEGEIISLGGSQFILYPGFQGWLSLGETPPDASTDLGSFPYDLGGLLEAVQDLELLGEEVLAGDRTHHLTGVFPVAFREALGLPSGVDAPTMDMWVGTEDLLPRRIESRVEDPPTDLEFTYSGYGAETDIRVPDDAIDADYLERLAIGDLSPEEIGQLVRIFPVPGQQCIEEVTSPELYSMMIGGDIGNNLLVWNAFRACAHRIFPFSFESAGSE